MTHERYKFEFSGRAARDLDKLPESIAAACVKFIARLLIGDPRRLGNPLRAPWKGGMSARRGDYRVIYTIDDQAGLVFVVHIDHRGRVYRRR